MTEGAENKKSKTDIGGMIFVVVFISVLLAIFGFIQWSSIFRIIGGGVVGIMALGIMHLIDEKSNRHIAIGIYLSGTLFAVVLSFLKYGLTSGTILDGALSWVAVFIMFR